MRSSTDIEPVGSQERYVWEFDRRQIDNPNPRAFTRLAYLQRVNSILQLVRLLAPPNGRVADIGCAQGNVAILLAEAGLEVHGYDLDPEFIAYARKKDDRGLVHWHVENAFESANSGMFDVIVLGEILEHVAHPQDLLSQAFERLAPAGLVIATTPNGRYLRERLPSYSQVLANAGLAEIERRQFGPGGEHHLFAYTTSELRGHVPKTAQLVSVGYIGSGLLNSHAQRLLNRPRIGALYQRLADAIQRVPLARRWFCLSLVLVLRKPS